MKIILKLQFRINSGCFLDLLVQFKRGNFRNIFVLVKINDGI